MRFLQLYFAVFIAASLISFTSILHAEDLRQNLFAEADAVLSAAQKKKAFVLAPDSFRKGHRLYKQADANLKKGKNLKSIQRDLAKAIQFLEQSIEASKLGEVTFSSVLKAREDARKAEAKKHAKELWIKAEEEFIDAALELEDGDVKGGQRGGAKAEKLYRDAELSAIKGNYLNETKNLLAKAEKMKVHKYAPKTLAKSKRLLAEAEQAVNKDRYDIDKPRDLARQAKYEANHSVYLAKRIMKVRDKQESMEDLILDYEKPITRIAGAANIVAELHKGYEKPALEIETYINDLQAKADQQESDIKELESQLGALSSERVSLKKREALQKQAEKIERMFARNEANVLRRGNDMILRLIGLNFGVGRASIDAKNFGLLSKVQNAINVFPGAKLVVEGHTDSFGSHKKNLTLSQKRAESVRQYLLANMKLNQNDVSAVGYGETVPVANNETPEGRKKNRRIDIVIKPKS